MDGVGSRLGRASSRYGPAPVFTGPVRKWKKQWVQVSSPPSSYSRSNKHNNDAPSLRLCKWTPISSTNSADNSGQPEEPPRRKFRYTPIVMLDEMKKEVGKRPKHEPATSKTFQSSPKEATKSDIFRKQDIDSLFVDQASKNDHMTPGDSNKRRADVDLSLKGEMDNQDSDGENEEDADMGGERAQKFWALN